MIKVQTKEYIDENSMLSLPTSDTTPSIYISYAAFLSKTIVAESVTKQSKTCLGAVTRASTKVLLLLLSLNLADSLHHTRKREYTLPFVTEYAVPALVLWEKALFSRVHDRVVPSLAFLASKMNVLS